ncbi:hypothetical protein CEUSTIGMA_g13168.t1 [Chlamydomonas eustigma]|uniref:Protein FAM221A n=1 Tax=Chlamydomonas eustigma TaxID=1157962 RepID=A0A250XRV9_9CHLO|nr:hypothetical protein CEUSTIGMA_g13168.t1 [Chlamydomonas eustigma]|eukprot:GAX85753.1 hypothetical protein CEUSTIGMA_g13168.t1 [Chlamydomonas eustigma]
MENAALHALSASRIQQRLASGQEREVVVVSQADGRPSSGLHVSKSSDEVVLIATTKSVHCHAWQCSVCMSECIPIRSESRCLCGHRYKEHSKISSGNQAAKCGAAKCKCNNFFFIVAEGAWILRCRCKHKHVEHDPVSHTCVKTGCQCVQFNSPWVCNCNHPWDVHTQLILEREVMTMNGLMMAAAADATDTRGVEGGGASSSSYTGSLMSSHSANYAADNKQGGLAARATDYFEVGGSLAPEVNRWDLLRRGGEESN